MTHPASVDAQTDPGADPRYLRTAWDWSPETIGRVAATLVVIQAVWRAWIAFQGYFSYDDYVFSYYASTSRINGAFLFRDHVGHLMPGSLLVTWLADRLSPLNYSLCVLLQLGLQALAAVAMYRLLRMLFGLRRGILVPLAFYLFTPLNLDAFLWWAAALNHLPLQLGMILAVHGHVRYVRGQGLRWFAVALGGFLLALSCFEKALLIPPLLLALSVLFFAQRRGLLGVIGRWWPAWTLYVATSLAYVGVYRHLVHFDFSYSPDTPTVAQLAGRVVGTTFLPGLVGGPWRWLPVGSVGGAADPPTAMKWLAWQVVIVAVVVSLLLRRHAARAWLLLASYLAADVMLLSIGRLSAVGPVIGQAYRYVADASVPATLTVALVLLPLPDNEGELTPAGLQLARWLRSRHWVALAAGALAVNAFALSALFSTQAYAALWSRNPGRQYVENAKASLATAPAGTVMLDDDVVPGYVLDFLSAPLNRQSAVFAPLRQRPAFAGSTEHLWLLDQTGHLVPGMVRGVDSRPGLLKNCGYAVTPDQPASIPLQLPVYAWAWTMRVGYLAGDNTPAHIRLGPQDLSVTLHKGLNDLFIPVTAGGSSVYVDSVKDGVGVCIDKVTIGLRYPVSPKTP